MSDQPVSVDGLSPPPIQPSAKQTDEVKHVKRWEWMLLILLGIFYAAYILWAFLLMSLLPSPDGSLDWLVPLALGSAALAALLLLAVGALLLLRIGQSKAKTRVREWSAIKVSAVVVPGLLISGALAFVVTRQPALGIDIVSPASSADLVAPLTMTFDLETALKVLSARGFHPIQYRWDINGDHKVDQQTIDPKLTATYEKEGIYTISVSMVGANGAVETASRRFIIARSVFTVTPMPPIVSQPVVFSVANLVNDPTTITQVQWDFNGDGKIDATTKDPEVTNTFYKTGDYKVTATVSLQNNTQTQYSRTVTVSEPAPLPFPVTLTSIPSHLIGPSPLAVLFSVDTKEPIAQVDWTFGDGQHATGNRVAHTYTQNGNFPVEAQVRSQSGVTATLDTVAQVVDPLSLPDLTFTGTPDVTGDKIEGQVPLTLNITPHTSVSFVTFSWEAPDADEVGSTDTNLQAIFRHEGTYTITLIGQDLNNHVLRKPITVQVDPPAPLVTFAMNPESGVAPLTVNFDASATSIPNDDITGFIWDYGDGSPQITQGAVVSHTYNDPRAYTIGLTVQTQSGKSYQSSRVLVVRAATLQACFTRSRNEVHANEAVQFFSGCTTGSIQSYTWDFGDGSQNDGSSPIHTFLQPGTYTVHLTVTDVGGTKSDFTSTITVQ